MASSLLLLFLAFIPALTNPCPPLQRKTYHSAPFHLGPGEVIDRFYVLDFPTGHIGIKNIIGEVVDEQGKSVTLNDVYLHHWAAFLYYVNSSESVPNNPTTSPSSILVNGNKGICQGMASAAFFGLGAETRNTNQTLPGDYANEVGDPKKVPPGYMQVWYINLHVIHTLDTVDPKRCGECLCELYNSSETLTTDNFGRPFKEGYIGGLLCCYDGTHCEVKESHQHDSKKTYFFRYTIDWVDWEDGCVIPVEIYSFDVTDTKERDPNNVLDVGCQIEHDVPQCEFPNGDCVYVRENHLQVPEGGEVVFGVAHQHTGGLKLSMDKEDGTNICTSFASTGNGTEPGDEEGFLVAMSSCYVEPGTVAVKENEMLRLRSYYSSDVQHTGVMSLFELFIVKNHTVVQKVKETEHDAI